jgi:hypothetical protein
MVASSFRRFAFGAPAATNQHADNNNNNNNNTTLSRHTTSTKWCTPRQRTFSRRVRHHRCHATTAHGTPYHTRQAQDQLPQEHTRRAGNCVL